jgi:hypothetical protein
MITDFANFALQNNLTYLLVRRRWEAGKCANFANFNYAHTISRIS